MAGGSSGVERCGLEGSQAGRRASHPSSELAYRWERRPCCAHSLQEATRRSSGGGASRPCKDSRLEGKQRIVSDLSAAPAKACAPPHLLQLRSSLQVYRLGRTSSHWQAGTAAAAAGWEVLGELAGRQGQRWQVWRHHPLSIIHGSPHFCQRACGQHGWVGVAGGEGEDEDLKAQQAAAGASGFWHNARPCRCWPACCAQV